MTKSSAPASPVRRNGQWTGGSVQTGRQSRRTTGDSRPRKFDPTSGGKMIGIGLLVILLVWALGMPLSTYAEQRAELARTRENIAMMEDRVAQLEAQKEKYSDPAYVEEQARVRLGLVKDGETPLRILDPGLNPETTQPPEHSKPKPAGTWHSLLWDSISVLPEVQNTAPNPGRDHATDPHSLPTVPE